MDTETTETKKRSIEETKAELEKLQKEVAEQERAEKERQQREKAASAKQVRDAVLNAAVDKLAEALCTAGIKVATDVHEDGWRAGQKRIKFESGEYLSIEFNVTYASRYSDAVIGMAIKVGDYGERPQSWKSPNADGFKYGNIVKSITKRLEDRKAQNEQRSKARELQKEAEAIREHNEPLALGVKRRFDPKAEKWHATLPCGASVEPSATTGNAVVVKFGSGFVLSPERAIELIEMMKKFNREDDGEARPSDS